MPYKDLEKKRQQNRKSVSEFWRRHPEYREKKKLQNRERYRNNPERVLQQRREYRKKNLVGITAGRYKITHDKAAQLLEQKKQGCEVCLSLIRRLHIDHDHKTGKVRGILCIGCNMALGQVKENPEILDRLSSYLRRHNSPDRLGYC